MEPVFWQRRQKGTKMECAIFVPELFIDSYCSRRKNCWNQRYRGCGREQYRYYFLLLTGNHPGNQHGFHPGNRFGSRTDRPGGCYWKKSRCRSHFRSYNHTRYWRSRSHRSCYCYYWKRNRSHIRSCSRNGWYCRSCYCIRSYYCSRSYYCICICSSSNQKYKNSF